MASEEIDAPITLDKLPVELLWKIFFHLNVPFLMHSVRLVCKHFYFILDDSFWKNKFKEITEKKQCVLTNILELEENPLTPGDEVGWMDLAYHTELEWEMWGTHFEHVRSINFSTHFATIDTVLLLDDSRICITGGRDRQLVVWDLVSESNKPLACDSRSHSGWIWDTVSFESGRFFTCGWDSHVFHWSVNNGALQEISSFYVEKPCMSIDAVPGLVVVGLNGGKVALFDPRLNLRNLYTYGIHNHVITDAISIDNIVYSISEDKTLGLFELRMMRSLKPNVLVGTKSSFPRCLSNKKNMLWIGDSKGVIRLYDTVNPLDVKYEFLASPTSSLITDIWAGTATIITGSVDRKVRIVTATEPATFVRELPIGGDVTKVDYHNKTLAVGSADNMLHVYKSHDAFDFVSKNL